MTVYRAKFSDGTELVDSIDKKDQPMTHAWKVRISVQGDEIEKVANGICTSEADAEAERAKCLAGIKWKGPITFLCNEVVPVTADKPQE